VTRAQAPPQPRTHDATKAEWPKVFESLSLAFEDDPISEFIFPEPEGRAARLRRFYALMIPMLVEHGRVISVEGLEGSAVWQAPKPPRPSRLGQFWLLARLVPVLGRNLGPVMTLGQMMDRLHLREPHWYLGFLGTAPSHQGQGFGSATMQPVLDLCDEQGILAYLESSKAQNVPFYERHGFSVTEEVQIPGGPKIWPMRREPRSR
jgi:GNAT superfamily N-acetyltransferase